MIETTEGQGNSLTPVQREQEQHTNKMAQQDEWVDLHRPYHVDMEDELRRKNEMRKINLYPPKKARSARTLFFKDERLKLKAINPDYAIADMDKEIVKIWKDTDFETKMKYFRLAELDLVRYRREQEKYTYKKYSFEFDDDGNLIEDDYSDDDETTEENQNSPEVAVEDDIDQQRLNNEPEDGPARESNPRKRAAEELTMPKRALSPRFWFTIEERSKIRAANPHYSEREISKELSKLWDEADPEMMAKYEHMAEMDRKRYKKDLNKYLDVDDDSEAEPEKEHVQVNGDVEGASTSNPIGKEAE